MTAEVKLFDKWYVAASSEPCDCSFLVGKRGHAAMASKAARADGAHERWATFLSCARFTDLVLDACIGSLWAARVNTGQAGPTASNERSAPLLGCFFSLAPATRFLSAFGFRGCATVLNA